MSKKANKNKVKFSGGWPTTMPRLTARDFVHSEWAHSAKIDSGIYNLEEDPIDADAAGSCGTRFCAVGWSRHAWGLPPEPSRFGKTPKNLHTFQKRLATNIVADIERRTGHKFDMEGYMNKVGCVNQYNLQLLLSDAYEGDLHHHRYDFRGDEMSEKDMARVWNQTVEEFGYTE